MSSWGKVENKEIHYVPVISCKKMSTLFRCLSEWNWNPNLSLLGWISNLSKLVLPTLITFNVVRTRLTEFENQCSKFKLEFYFHFINPSRQYRSNCEAVWVWGMSTDKTLSLFTDHMICKSWGWLMSFLHDIWVLDLSRKPHTIHLSIQLNKTATHCKK